MASITSPGHGSRHFVCRRRPALPKMEGASFCEYGPINSTCSLIPNSLHLLCAIRKEAWSSWPLSGRTRRTGRDCQRRQLCKALPVPIQSSSFLFPGGVRNPSIGLHSRSYGWRSYGLGSERPGDYNDSSALHCSILRPAIPSRDRGSGSQRGPGPRTRSW